MKEKYFSINEAGSSIRCKLYYNDLKAVSRAGYLRSRLRRT